MSYHSRLDSKLYVFSLCVNPYFSFVFISIIMILQDNEVEYSTIMNIGGNLDVRDVIFQGNSNRVRNTKDSIISCDIGVSNQ